LKDMSTRRSAEQEGALRGMPVRGATPLSGEELAAAAGIRPAKLARLIQLGLVEPTAPGADEFTAATLVRVRRMLRLHVDLGIHLVDAGIIVDLIERMDALEAELSHLRAASAT
jgi:chaperone modulatory protein CbpM